MLSMRGADMWYFQLICMDMVIQTICLQGLVETRK